MDRKLMFLMDENDEGTPASGDVTVTATPEATPDATPDATATPPGDPAAATAAAEATPYTPNFGYRVLGEDREIPEWLRDKIDSEDREKEVRDIFERADGLPHVKKERDTFRSRFEEVVTQHQALVDRVVDITEAAKSNDYGYIIEQLKLDPQKLALHLLHKYGNKKPVAEGGVQPYPVDEEALAEQRRLRRESRVAKREANDVATKQLDFELTQALDSADVKQFVRAFDSKKEPGAFRMMVIQRAHQLHQETGKSPSVKEAIDAVLEFYKPFLSVEAQANAATPGQTASQTGAPNNKSLPVIPKVQGNNASVVQKPPRSIEDLRKIAAAKGA